MKLAKLVLTIGLLLIGTTLLGADQDASGNLGQKNQPAQNPKQLSFEVNTTSQVLEHTVDLWHDAVLKGNDKQSDFFFGEICNIITEDIQENDIQMKMLVREIEYMYRENSSEGENLIEANHNDKKIDEYKKYLPIISSSICIKEELFRALSRTNAFSNKYRLLGDYKNLLRKELGMPKLQVADLQSQKGKQASTDK